MNLEFTSREVAYSREGILAVTAEQVALLRRLAAESPLGRARLCAHHSPGDPVHEMLIVVEKRSYLRPHRHVGKSESFHMVQGAMDVVVFTESGEVSRVIPLSAYGGEGAFYYRLSESLFHTLVLRSEWVLFQETTNGPFDPAASLRAPWAPPEDAPAADIAEFRERLERAVR